MNVSIYAMTINYIEDEIVKEYKNDIFVTPSLRKAENISTRSCEISSAVKAVSCEDDFCCLQNIYIFLYIITILSIYSTSQIYLSNTLQKPKQM